VHIPDGMIKAGMALGSGAISLGAVGASLVAAGRRLRERQIPLIGLVAAFLLVLQMIHIPLGPGVNGRLMGGALAAILLGPGMGIVVLAAVVLVATVGLGQGGISTLGANIALTSLVAGFGGFWLFRSLLLAMPRTRRGFLAATALAAWATTLLVSAAASALLTYGGVFGAARLAPVPFAMSGLHLVVGLAEAVVTVAAVGAVMAARPDLMATHDLLPAAGTIAQEYA
jgi:cobalt/nickel transport system permease protein